MSPPNASRQAHHASMTRAIIGAALAALLSPLAVNAAATEILVTMHAVDANGIGAEMGTVKIRKHRDGIEFFPNLQGLTMGEHGFHIHETASCKPAQKDGQPVAAGAAGGHWDPYKTGKHQGPVVNAKGHAGDLPPLTVASDGKATLPVFAERIQDLSSLKGKSLIIHEGGDNLLDEPLPAGGGGKRIACGVIR